MDPAQSHHIEVALIWDRSISDVLRVLGGLGINRTLVVEALTSAHREKSGLYSSDGNRPISSIGRTGLTAGIKFGRTKEEFRDRVRHWEKLETHQGIVQVAVNSPLRRCIASSARQNGLYSQVPLSKKVVAYAVWGLIGAVYLGSGRDLRVTCQAIDTLCRYLDPDFSALLDFEMQPLVGLPSQESALGSDHAAHGLSTSHDFQMELDGTFSNWHPTEVLSGSGYTSVDPASEDWASVIQDFAAVGEPLTSFNTNLLPNELSVAHASVEGQQIFFRRIAQPVELLRERSANVAVPDNEARKPKRRSRAAQKIDEYIEAQRQLYRTSISAENVQFSPTLTGSDDMPSENPKHQTTMRKLYHGLVSATAIVSIKSALAARRQPAPQISVGAEAGAMTKPIYHYHLANHPSNANSQNAIETLFHTYMVYINLRGEYKSALDEGFVHNDQQTLDTSLTVGEVATPGNPINKNLSKDYENMLRCAEPDFDWKPEDEKSRLRDSLDRLRKRGERLYCFVNKFGIGVLCMLTFMDANIAESHALSMSESQFSSLPVTEKMELDVLIELLTQGGHPLVLFAEAARPILTYIVDKALPGHQRFECERTEITRIMNLQEGSQDLLAQLSTF